MSEDRALSFGPAGEAVFLLVTGLILAGIGYKIKGVLGSILTLLAGGAVLLYMKGYF
ncbi:MAG: hypothetical protein JRJ47_14625 [Deltaproteobacteria bacterium]|nr:hypothetical protein [Deltaproteobacteria bacterium]